MYFDETKKQGKHIVLVYYIFNSFRYNSTHGFGIKSIRCNLMSRKIFLDVLGIVGIISGIIGIILAICVILGVI